MVTRHSSVMLLAGLGLAGLAAWGSAANKPPAPPQPPKPPAPKEAIDGATGLSSLEVFGGRSPDLTRGIGKRTNTQINALLGAPVEGLTMGQMQDFIEASDTFHNEEGIEDGLGPVFNGRSCGECHPQGHGTQTMSVHIGTLKNGAFDPLTNVGGQVLQLKGIGQVPGFNFVGETIPKEATIVAHRRSMQLFGLGLLTAVPDSTIVWVAVQQAMQAPELTGHPNIVTDIMTGKAVVGRVGQKAQHPNPFNFAIDAYKNEMGITVKGVKFGGFDQENCPQGNCDALKFNPHPEPDTLDDVEEFATFMSLLAPPLPSVEIGSTKAKAGFEAFKAANCAICHCPTLKTGVAPWAALTNKEIHPFTDLLVHDMGALGDGITQQQCSGKEQRTTPLWGLRHQTKFLHDGRASTVEQAILGHAGQATSSVNKYKALNANDKAALLFFLSCL